MNDNTKKNVAKMMSFFSIILFGVFGGSMVSKIHRAYGFEIAGLAAICFLVCIFFLIFYIKNLNLIFEKTISIAKIGLKAMFITNKTKFYSMIVTPILIFELFSILFLSNDMIFSPVLLISPFSLWFIVLLLCMVTDEDIRRGRYVTDKKICEVIKCSPVVCVLLFFGIINYIIALTYRTFFPTWFALLGVLYGYISLNAHNVGIKIINCIICGASFVFLAFIINAVLMFSLSWVAPLAGMYGQKIRKRIQAENKKTATKMYPGIVIDDEFCDYVKKNVKIHTDRGFLPAINKI